MHSCYLLSQPCNACRNDVAAYAQAVKDRDTRILGELDTPTDARNRDLYPMTDLIGVR